MKRNKICIAAVLILLVASTNSYVRAEGNEVEEAFSSGENEVEEVFSSGEIIEDLEEETPIQIGEKNTKAVYQDEKIAVFTQGYLAEDISSPETDAEDIKTLVLSITLDGKLAKEQTLGYFADPGELQIDVEDSYAMDALLLDGQPFENGAAVIYGEETQRKIEIALHTKAQLIVHYQDTEGNSIVEDTVLSGKLGQEIFWENPQIQGYECDDETGQVVMETAIKEVTVVYRMVDKEKNIEPKIEGGKEMEKGNASGGTGIICLWPSVS